MEFGNEKKRLQDHYDHVKAMKEAELDYKKREHFFKQFPHTACPQNKFCESEQCPMRMVGTCSGCHHVKCLAKVCGNWCMSSSGYNLCYERYEKCGKMPTEFVLQDLDELGTFSLDDLMELIKPTKPLDLDTTFIPGVAPYGKHAPGEIVKFPGAFVDLTETDNLCMVPSNQLPMNYPPTGENELDINPEEVFMKQVDLRKYVGVKPGTKIFLNFRMKDFLLNYWWTRMVYDGKNGPYQTLFKVLKDMGVDYTVCVNFSMWDRYPLYTIYFNMIRSLISYIQLQKYFPNVVLEFDYQPHEPQVDKWYFKIIEQCGISTIHQNFQIKEGAGISSIIRQPLHEDFKKNLACDEIILGGASNTKDILKYSKTVGDKKIYVTHTRAYLGTVFQQHMSGRKWKGRIPPASDEFGRAMYYKNLFEENVRYYSKKLERVGL